MNAKEMFEELGYSLEVNSEDLIKYSRNVCGYTFFRFRLKNKEFCSGYQSVAHTATRDELKAVIQQFKELGWTEEEKQKKTKEETNFEHFFEYLSTKRMSDFALIDGRITQCSVTRCSKCGFNNDCIEGKFTWLKQPYEKPKYKLTRVDYDILDTIFEKEARFSTVYLIGELKKKGYFENIKCDNRVLVKDILANCEVIQ